MPHLLALLLSLTAIATPTTCSYDTWTWSVTARRIVGLWRGRPLRRWWRAASRLLWGLMRDPESGEDFFVNVATLRTSWDQPRVFGRELPRAGFRRIFPCTLSPQPLLPPTPPTAPCSPSLSRT